MFAQDIVSKKTKVYGTVDKKRSGGCWDEDEDQDGFLALAREADHAPTSFASELTYDRLDHVVFGSCASSFFLFTFFGFVFSGLLQRWPMLEVGNGSISFDQPTD